MAGPRQRVSSGAPWEALVGYSRAVRSGDFIAVSGTTAVGNDGKLIGEGDAYQQTVRCIEIIRAALQQAGADLRHVIRTRIYVTDITLWQEIARAHQQAFDGVRPATSMVEVSRLIDPAMLVEIEADAIVDD
ncbi:MAG: RidA family protein [Gammaproteobacteria bacterium]|nr:RidA family protein [Gammaproteobacteria bacterium]MDH5304922.1 RidA family protein [Gammaproteobacteria bacterium]MDH5322142.1 RidA family protein [Gammaproteobacteria bacterium]